MIKEQEAGMPNAEVCRKHGISTASFYKYKAKFGGTEVSDARKLKALEDENAKLNKLLAEQMLDNAMLFDERVPHFTSLAKYAVALRRAIDTQSIAYPATI